ncbi:Ger(x)C family spore germination protein [Shimazuella sp. AN120528]|uniref:Ger(x)C family spore germination protein n=1 Tax=Shimazuella soli TaxID=1892854 RepID=UPI001F0E0BB3|nr:Ger(x)C family spore germination protein [Shimazuella soli]
MANTKRLCKTLIFVICTVLIVGCWNRRELNDLAVAVAIGIDKADKKILLTDQVLIPEGISGQKGGSSNLAPVILFQTKGEGIQEAARKMTNRGTRKIYVGQLQILIFGEKFAKQGVSKVLDHIIRDHEYRRDFYVAIAKNHEAQDVLKVFTALEKMPSTKLKSALENSSKAWGETTAVKIDDFISAIISKGREPVLSGIKMTGDQKFLNEKENAEKISTPLRLSYGELAVFKKDKLLGWLNEKESIGYNFTQGNIKSTSVVLKCPKNTSKNLAVELLRTKTDTKVIMKHNKPVIHLKLKTKGVISDAQCEMDFTTPSTISQVEKLTENQVKNSIVSAINTVQQKYKSDIFGFGEEVERSSPAYWERVKKNWDQVFSDLEVKVEVKSKIEKMFKTTKSLTERMEE